MEKTLTINKTYDIVVSVGETQYPRDHVYIKFQSRWSGAVDPHGLQKRFDITLSKEHAIELCRLIEEASCASKE
jgi:hypothetical protein